DDRPIKLFGTAEIRLGKSPRLDAVFSAVQIDLDRALDLPDPSRRLPLVALRTFAERLLGGLRMPIPARFGLGIETATLAGATVQAMRGDAKADADGWVLETFELRAPGQTQARLSGRLALASDGAAFTGPLTLESGDPKTLVAWLEGRSEPRWKQAGALRASG